MPKPSRPGKSVKLLTLLKYWIVIQISLFVIVVGNADVGFAGKIKDKDKLLQKARNKGKVRIIVHFDDAEIDSATSRTIQADAARSKRIKKAADRFIARLLKANYRINARPKHIPFIALSVNAKALEKLESLLEVLTVVEDVPVPAPDPPEPPASVPPGSFPMPGADSQIGAESAWTMGYTGKDWYVAVLDTGVRSSHEMFAGKTIIEHCFSSNDAVSGALSACPDGAEESEGPGSAAPVASRYTAYGHGTHVAGIAAGDSPDLKGVAVDADIIAVQVFTRFDSSEFCGGGDCVMSYISDQTRALDWIYEMRHTYPIAAVNMSLGGGYYTVPCDSDSRKAAIDNLKSAGIAVVVSAGNNYHCDGIGAPACISSAIAIGAADDGDVMADFSNWGIGLIDLLAPGSVIFSAVATGDADYEAWNGTSMAAPFATGAWALMKQKRPEAEVDTLLNAVQSTANTVIIPCGWESVDRHLRVDSAVQTLNRFPLALAGVDLTVTEGTTVTLDGRDSYDPDLNDTLTYEWSGPVDILLSDTSITEPWFTAPEVGSQGRHLEFQLAVRDNHDSVVTDTVRITVTDPFPWVDTGGDLATLEGMTVTLDGSASTDPGGSPGDLSFYWQQIGGTDVSLTNSSAAVANFVAPAVGPGGAALLFQLAVTDSAGQTGTGTCTVAVGNINQSPSADAGSSQQVIEGTNVTLDASGSTDPDGNQDIAAYQWTQTGGPPVSLTNPASVAASFAAPLVGPSGENLVFELTVTDGSGATSTDSCTIVIDNLDKAPRAEAGSDQQVYEGAAVILDGSGSTDPDGLADISSYRWIQTGGPAIALTDADKPLAGFTAPMVELADETLTFELTVRDGSGLEHTDNCAVIVKNINQSPVSDAGLDQVTVEGATILLSGGNSSDPDDDTLSYHWTQIGGEPQVTLSDQDAIDPTFVCSLPAGTATATLTFQLSVSDQNGLVGTDEVQVVIEDNQINGFPDTATTAATTGGTVGLLTEDESRLVKLDIVDPDTLPTDASDPKDYPYGMLDLAVKVPVSGMATTVTVHFDEPLPKRTVWMKYNPNTGWEDYTGKVVFKNNRTTAVIQLVDGGVGDDDGIANGIIVDPSGPAISAAPDSPSPAPGGSGGGGGCFITTAIGQ